MAAQGDSSPGLLHVRHDEGQEKGKPPLSRFIFYRNADNIPDKDIPQMTIKELYKEVCTKHPEFREYFPDYPNE